MRINRNYILRQIADTWTVLPLAEETLNMDGMIVLNDAGVLLWKVLENGAELADLTKALTDAYIVGNEQAMADVIEFVETLRKVGCLEE